MRASNKAVAKSVKPVQKHIENFSIMVSEAETALNELDKIIADADKEIQKNKEIIQSAKVEQTKMESFKENIEHILKAH